ncbi:hypothetical protein GCM10008986_21470 [Salinibacillus aidingensis]|uniref:Uncharacterized protein n=1 Tax=Salinibacillus aidingensis TaxID=237684 RepID=A0ABN1BC20_9BACI
MSVLAQDVPLLTDKESTHIPSAKTAIHSLLTLDNIGMTRSQYTYNQNIHLVEAEHVDSYGNSPW